MTDKELIKQEIERLINDKTDGEHVAKADITAPKRSAYLDILNFIDSLPEEPVNEDLEEEIDRFEEWLNSYNQSDYPTSYTVRDIARHFAEWGRNHFEDKSEMVSEDLEEAAEKYAKEQYPWQNGYEKWELPIRDFKAGAEWQKQKAMQDFMEKAERFFKEELFTRFSGIEYRVASNKCINLQQFIEQFKNYMEDEN